jgi:hypothetical protein
MATVTRTLCSMKAIALALSLLLLTAVPAHAQDDEDPLLPLAGTCAHEDNPDAHHRLQRLAMHCLLDEMRALAGLPRLEASVFLRHSSTFKARRIADCRVFSHFPCGDRLAGAFDRAGLARQGRWLVGENLGYGVEEGSTAREILAKWLRSPTHRAVLEDERFAYVGVRRRRLAMRGAPEGSVIWVAHLGVPRRR